MSVVLLLLFPMKAALATSSVYVVTGISSFFDGIYEEKREPELHYKKLGEAAYNGDYSFLYTDSLDHWLGKDFVHCSGLVQSTGQGREPSCHSMELGVGREQT